MKKFFIPFFLFFFLFLLSSHGQVAVPNAGFEDWESSTEATYWTSNFSGTVMGLFPINYKGGERTTEAYSGSYAMKLKRNTISIMGNTIEIPGICQLGEFNIDSIIAMVMAGGMDLDIYQMVDGGAPFSEVPFNVKVWVKFIPEEGKNDTMQAHVYLISYNDLTGNEIVARGSFTTAETMNDYTQITIPIEEVIPGETPNFINIVFAGASSYNCGNAKLYIDDITVETPSGIKVINQINFNVYPNPCKNFFVIQKNDNSVFDLEMYDLLGKKVWQKASCTPNNELYFENLTSGTYFLKLIQGNKIATQKIVIE